MSGAEGTQTVGSEKHAALLEDALFQVKRVIVPLAVDAEGKRLVAWERHPEKLWHAQPSSQPGANSEGRLSLFRETLEPMLQRELEHRGLAKGNRGFETKLIGWVEVKHSVGG